jgi:hypothetical protein
MAKRQRERRETVSECSRDQWRRLAVEAGMLALLVALALVFLTTAPS